MNRLAIWPPVPVSQSRADLDALSATVSGLLRSDMGSSDSDVQSRLGYLLIVRSCGHLETTQKECLEGLHLRLFGSVVTSYIHSMSFTRGSNPSSSYLLELLGRIAPEEAKEALKEFLKGKFRSKNSSFDERKYQDILNDLVRIRNNIAHGEQGILSNAEDSLEYKKAAIDICDWYLSYFEPKGKAEQLYVAHRSDPLYTKG